MSSINKVFIMGHVGLPPEKHGDMVCVSVATTEKWKDKETGEKKEATEWHRIVFFGKLTDIALSYIRKGSHVHIEGSLHTKKYLDKDGAERYATSVRSHKLTILDKKPVNTSAPNPYAQASMSSAPRTTSEHFDETYDYPV
jgi:single-strand DNA-binding protein